jgi:RNA polymerase sigma factor (sigma-70 family)
VERHVGTQLERSQPAGGRGAGFGVAFESVLLAAQSGAPWALERLYQALSPAVLGYLRVQGASDPEDLTNEVFLGVFRKVGDFRGGEEKFRSWVFTIAHSRLVDERRRAMRRPQLAGGDHPVPESAGGDAEDDALERLSAQRVQALCEQLVPDQRDVLLLRLLAGLTVEAVAEALGKSAGAVKALQRRGLANLRKVLEGNPVPL